MKGEAREGPVLPLCITLFSLPNFNNSNKTMPYATILIDNVTKKSLKKCNSNLVINLFKVSQYLN